MYKMCPKAWSLRYQKKLERPERGASLFFGMAVDSAVEELLKEYKRHNTEAARIPDMSNSYMNIFHTRWMVANSFGTDTPIFDNPNVVYSHVDFDADVLTHIEVDQLYQWAIELKLIELKKQLLKKDVVELYKTIAKKKKNPYLKLQPEELLYFNRASWLSMKKKGELMIESFKSQFLPKITNIIATQQRGDIKDHSSGDSIMGFIDMVLEIEGYDKPIIFDLKTAARPYTQEHIELTDQLTLYAAMRGQDYQTDLVGYVVLCKNINKESISICKKCGFTKDGRHKTCNHTIVGAFTHNKPKIPDRRCNGEWETKTELKPEVQVLVKAKTQDQIYDLLTDYANIILAMKNSVIYKNTDKCNSWYGSRCPYYDLCHHNKMDGLIDKSRKST